VGGFEHQCADRVVAAQVAPDLLFDQRRGFRSQHRLGVALVGFEFTEAQLDLPALCVGVGQLDRGSFDGVEQRGEQPEGFCGSAAVVDLVVDHPDRDRLAVAPGVA